MREGSVREHEVGTHTDTLGVESLSLLVALAEPASLKRSPRREIARVEEKDDPPSPAVVCQPQRAIRSLAREVRSGLALAYHPPIP